MSKLSLPDYPGPDDGLDPVEPLTIDTVFMAVGMRLHFVALAMIPLVIVIPLAYFVRQWLFPDSPPGTVPFDNFIRKLIGSN